MLDLGVMNVKGLGIKQNSKKAGYIGGLGHQRQKYLDTLVRDIFRI